MSTCFLYYVMIVLTVVCIRATDLANNTDCAKELIEIESIEQINQLQQSPDVDTLIAIDQSSNSCKKNGNFQVASSENTEQELYGEEVYNEDKLCDLDKQTIMSTKKKKITITNSIEPTMLEYSYWGTHTPESFTIYINEQEIKHGEMYEMSVEQREVKVIYSYSFAAGMYKGSKEVTCEMSLDAHEEQLTFSWNESRRIIISNATILKEEKIKYR